MKAPCRNGAGADVSGFDRALADAMSRPGFTEWVRLLVHAARLGPGRRFLDVGGGRTLLARAMADTSGAEAVMVDIAPDEASGVRCVAGDAHDLPFADGAMDAVLFSCVVHLLEDPVRAFAEAARVLSPSGVVLVRLSSHEDLMALPEARWIPNAIRSMILRYPNTPDIVDGLHRAGLLQTRSRRVWVSRADVPLGAYAERLARLAREDSFAPEGGDARDAEVRAWAATFAETPPERETLIVAKRPNQPGVNSVE